MGQFQVTYPIIIIILLCLYNGNLHRTLHTSGIIYLLLGIQQWQNIPITWNIISWIENEQVIISTHFLQEACKFGIHGCTHQHIHRIFGIHWIVIKVWIWSLSFGFCYSIWHIFLHTIVFKLIWHFFSFRLMASAVQM